MDNRNLPPARYLGARRKSRRSGYQGVHLLEQQRGAEPSAVDKALRVICAQRGIDPSVLDARWKRQTREERRARRVAAVTALWPRPDRHQLHQLARLKAEGLVKDPNEFEFLRGLETLSAALCSAILDGHKDLRPFHDFMQELLRAFRERDKGNLAPLFQPKKRNGRPLSFEWELNLQFHAAIALNTLIKLKVPRQKAAGQVVKVINETLKLAKPLTPTTILNWRRKREFERRAWTDEDVQKVHEKLCQRTKWVPLSTGANIVEDTKRREIELLKRELKLLPAPKR